MRAQQAAKIPNGVEITKIHGPSASTSSSMHNGPNLAVGSNRNIKMFPKNSSNSSSCDPSREYGGGGG